VKLLIIGGTLFLGRHIVDAAYANGHEVTLFNRGRTRPELFPEAEKIHGDRMNDLHLLEGRRWDAVVDTCGYVPRVVRASADALRDAIDLYAYISSMSVYNAYSRPGMDEGAPVQTLADPSTEQVTVETYGGLKALCEQAVEQACPGRAVIVRSGLIVGPHDQSDRFTFWVRRVAAGGEVLAPVGPGTAVQFIDVRDMSAWIVRMIEDRATGVFNVTSPAGMFTMGDVLETSKRVARSDARFTWASEEFLLAEGVAPWTEMPLWLPSEHAIMLTGDVGRALARGLAFRPLDDTVRDTWDWERTRDPADRPERLPSGAPTSAGLSPKRERELLARWHEHAPRTASKTAP
jgi:2'-hydroxyisoflavone reductase